MPPLVGVAGDVHGIRAPCAWFLLQGEAPHRHGLGRIPQLQSSPREQPPEEVRVWLHPEEGLADGDEASDM